MTDYKRMFEQAVRTLADIDEAIGIGDNGCGDPDQTLTAIAELKSAKVATVSAVIMDQTNEQEFQIVKYMIEHATQHGVEVEVILAFANELRNGQKDFNRAANDAMHEWDV